MYSGGFVDFFSPFKAKNDKKQAKTLCILLLLTFSSFLLFYGSSKLSLTKRSPLSTIADQSEVITERDFGSAGLTLIPGNSENGIFLEEKFENYFENEKILEFKKNYISKCHPGRAVFGGILHGNSYSVGLGAMMNAAFSAYVIAAETGRSFQLIHFLYAYSNPDHFLTDFASNTSCPIFPVVRGRAMAQLRNNSRNFTVAFNEARNLVNLTGPKFTALMFGTPQIAQVCETIRKLRVRDGDASIDARKSEFLRAVWNPQAQLKSLLKKLWLSLVKDSPSYFGVHLRRGDKISTYEMNFIPIKNYAEHLVQWCELLKEKCPKTVFVTSDDPEALAKLRVKLKRTFLVKDLGDLVKETMGGMNLGKYVMPLRGKSPFGIQHMTIEKWDRHTREVLLTITLLAMSDYVLCTLSSNLCRLVAQFRADRDIDSLHSLDLQQSSC